ncbi:transcription factor bHLH61-like [Bidens hawaiensis]|uniref:transcription factor bHLH61-like n=1 Tax=Bidens hawaiensis TaxID=980011 RepID=UPI00404AC16F
MGSKEDRRTALYQKIRELRSVTHSNAVHKTSIVVEVAKYIEELKEKVEKLHQDITSSSEATSIPMKATVETLDKGFRINVFSEEECPGLLVSLLEAFEELGLDVRDVNVSCSNKFHLQAIGENEGHVYDIDALVVKRAVLKAIKHWSDNNGED